MTIEEAKKAMEQMKIEYNLNDDEIISLIYKMYKDSKLTFEEFDALVDAWGYQLTLNFKNMTDEDRKTEFTKNDYILKEELKKFNYKKVKKRGVSLEQVKKSLDEMKKKGVTDDDLLGVLYLMFQDDKLTFEELDALVDFLGYQITEEFRNMSLEEQKVNGFKEDKVEDDYDLSNVILDAEIDEDDYDLSNVILNGEKQK